MIDDKAHNPCNSKLEEDKAGGDPSAFRFPADRCNSCGTRNIQKTEYHKGVGVDSAESHSAQSGSHSGHSVSCCNILDAEQDAAAGYDHFFCGDSGDQSYNNLPVAKPKRSEDGNNGLADIGAKT